MEQIIIDQQNGVIALRLERFVDLSELGLPSITTVLLDTSYMKSTKVIPVDGAS